MKNSGPPVEGRYVSFPSRIASARALHSVCQAIIMPAQKASFARLCTTLCSYCKYDITVSVNVIDRTLKDRFLTMAGFSDERIDSDHDLD